MNYIIYFKKTIFLVFLTVFLTVSAFAQTPKSITPRQDTLLNGLKVLIWSDPTAEKITIKLRIHSGAIFDPQDKMGVMVLLLESLFPTDQARAFFTEDLDGSLNLTGNYDYLQITATGKTTELLSMIETISNAVINPQINPENFKLIQNARLKIVEYLEKKTKKKEKI
jgi:predicted Zn-dependent peptidase